MTTRPDAPLDRYLALAAAIVWRAALDARHADARGARARRWLESDPWAREILAALDVGVDRRVVGDLRPRRGIIAA